MMKSILKYFLTPAGIYQKLDYVKEIGVDVIWIQPFYKSPMLDNGYDVADYKSVGPLFGTIEDFKKLLKGVHDRGKDPECQYVIFFSTVLRKNAEHGKKDSTSQLLGLLTDFCARYENSCTSQRYS